MATPTEAAVYPIDRAPFGVGDKKQNDSRDARPRLSGEVDVRPAQAVGEKSKLASAVPSVATVTLSVRAPNSSCHASSS